MKEEYYTCICGFGIIMSRGMRRTCSKCGRQYHRLKNSEGTVYEVKQK